MPSSPNASRNVGVLLIAQVLSMTATTAIVLIGGIIGSQLASSPALATLPIAVSVVGVALFTIPASFFMKRFGRKRGFQAGALMASLAALLAAVAVTWQSFFLFCLALFFIGGNSSFVQQYRFAASESVPLRLSSRAVSTVLLGGVLGGFLGPEIATRTQNVLSLPEYSFTFITLSALYLGIALLMSLFITVHQAVQETSGVERPLSAILRQPGFQVAVLAGVVSYGVMSMLMTATPISMHTIQGHSLEATGWVIRSHVIAMFLPSLFSGSLISRLGTSRVMGLGVIAMVLCAVLDLAGSQFLNYWTALVLLGIGWNFLFVGGTVMLTQHYYPDERFKAQAFNDFSIFGIQAIASLSAGSLIYLTSWRTMNLLVLPILMLMLLAIFLVARRASPATATSPS